MDGFSKEKRSEIMRRIRSKNTKPEEMLCKGLFRLGFRYRKNDARLPGKPDIVFVKYRLVVFVHGCFWHNHEGCRYAAIPKTNQEYWLPKLARNSQRDSINEAKLKERGWRVAIVWECDMRKDAAGEIKKIADLLNGKLIEGDR